MNPILIGFIAFGGVLVYGTIGVFIGSFIAGISGSNYDEANAVFGGAFWPATLLLALPIILWKKMSNSTIEFTKKRVTKNTSRSGSKLYR